MQNKYKIKTKAIERKYKSRKLQQGKLYTQLVVVIKDTLSHPI